MNYFICTTLDLKADAYMQPFFISTIAVAKRAFADCVNNKEHEFGKHPEDYHLVQIGVYHSADGTITPEEVPYTLATGMDLVRAANREGEDK